MTNQEILAKIKGKLIVSCQALPDEPLHGSEFMAKMAFAAKEGGAAGIRCNTVEDIHAIKQAVDLPTIGIIKAVYEGSDVYITPTMKEVDALMEEGVSIMALDATNRIRPDGKTLEEFFEEVRKKYPNQLFMADASSYEEGIQAAKLGFDLVGTTMHGYTPYTKGVTLPDYDMIHRLATELDVPIIAEGGIWVPEQLKEALAQGAFAAVVGTAITRPRDITKRFVAAIS